MSTTSSSTSSEGSLESWSKEDVQQWFLSSDYQEHASSFPITGRQLAGLTKADFNAALGPIVGACLFTDVQHLKAPQQAAPPQQGKKRKLAAQPTETETETETTKRKRKEAIKRRRRLSPANSRTITTEGLAAIDPIRSDRTETCQKLYELLTEHAIVYLRAPPETGKTSLATLLEEHLKGQRIVKFVSLLSESYEGFDTCWQAYTQESLSATMEAQEPTLLIVDEVQVLYNYDNHEFWIAIKKILQSANAARLVVLLLAAYGAGPAVIRQDATPTPVSFKQQSYVDFSMLRLTAMEFREIIDGYNNTREGKYVSIIPESVAYECLEKMCGGHVGLVRHSLSAISQNFLEGAKMGQSPTDEDIYFFLLSSDFIARLSTSSRAIPKKTDFSEEESILLRQIILEPGGYIAKGDESNAMITSLSKLGLLAIDKGVRVGFASPILRHILIMRLFSSKLMDNASLSAASLEDKLLAIIALINSRAMGQSFSVGVNLTVLERQWQMEFYRAASLIFEEATISPDVGRLFGSRGFLDFYIDSRYKWGIELLRNGNNLEQHLCRFKPGGIYHKFTQKLNSYHVIDFRKEGSQDCKPVDEHHWLVYYRNDFKTARVVFERDGVPQTVEIIMGVIPLSEEFGE